VILKLNPAHESENNIFNLLICQVKIIDDSYFI
jgi:hypothetical protein